MESLDPNRQPSINASKSKTMKQVDNPVECVGPVEAAYVRTQIAVPGQGCGFENFDRLAGILMRVRPKKKDTCKSWDDAKHKRIAALVATRIV